MKKYRIIIAGGREYADFENVKHNMYYVTKDMEYNEIEIVSGGCSDLKNGVHTFTRKDGKKIYGADGLGERLAEEKGWPVASFDANWDINGKAAGVIRNTAMATYATHSLCFWDGKSRGTKDMIAKSEKFGLRGETINYAE
jgi:hypothetical protein